MKDIAPEITPEIAQAVRRVLLRLARLEDELACTEAAQVPYWAPCPDSVRGHRAAARALEAEADSLLAG